MAADAHSDDVVREILERSRVIALVGASPRPERASHEVMAFLQARGYRVIPVNPACAGDEILGEPVRASLEEIDVPIDLVDVFRASEAAGPVCDAAVAIGAKAVWMQLGVVHAEAAARAENAGVTVIMDRCPKIEMPRLGMI